MGHKVAGGEFHKMLARNQLLYTIILNKAIGKVGNSRPVVVNYLSPRYLNNKSMQQSATGSLLSSDPSISDEPSLPTRHSFIKALEGLELQSE